MASTKKGIPLINLEDVADITLINNSLTKIDELLETLENTENTTTEQKINDINDKITAMENNLSQHINNVVNNNDGIHAFRYDEATKKLQYKKNNDWVDISVGGGDISVSGLTAETLKVGVSVVITKDGQTIKTINGTYTNDANATNNDVLNGKTAYVNGNKITGNIPTNTGDQIVSIMTTDNDLLKTGVITNAYYKNAKICIRKGNLVPSNIKTGVNIYGINGTYTSDANATSNDIVNGKTAYVNGNKIVGNMYSRSGNQYIDEPTVTGDYLYTPYVANGNYNNARFYFRRGNLQPYNIKKGVRIFGVDGTHEGENKKLLAIITCSSVSFGNSSTSIVILKSYSPYHFDDKTTNIRDANFKIKQSANVIINGYANPQLDANNGTVGITVNGVNSNINNYNGYLTPNNSLSLINFNAGYNRNNVITFMASIFERL